MEQHKNESFTILYPNPLDDQTLKVDFGQITYGQLSIVNAQGAIVYNHILTGEKIALVSRDVFNKGVYFVRIQSLDKTTVYKLIVN